MKISEPQQQTTLRFGSNPQPAFKIGDRVTAPVPVYPKWWQFWRKPHQEMREFTIVATSSGDQPDAE